MSDRKPEMLDQVQTEEGVGLVVGLPEFDQVEVRFPSKGGRLGVFPVSRVVVIDPEAHPDGTTLEATTTEKIEGPGLTYAEARAAGQAPQVDLSQFGDLGVAQAPANPDAKPKSTLAEKVAAGEPLSASGRPLSGAAKQRALAKRAREQRGDG